jgi:hypothetical protein
MRCSISFLQTVIQSVNLHRSIYLPHEPEASIEANGTSQHKESIRYDQHIAKVQNA